MVSVDGAVLQILSLPFIHGVENYGKSTKFEHQQNKDTKPTSFIF